MTFIRTNKRNHDLSYNPVGLWQLNSTLVDTSGNGFNLSVNTGTERYTELVPGIVGARFDGAYVLYVPTAEASLQITGDLTIETLVTLERLNTFSFSFVRHSDAGSAEAENVLYGFRALGTGVSNESNNLGFVSESGAAVAATYDVDHAIVSGITYHLAMTRSSGQISYYINGTQFGATSSALTTPTGGTTGRFTVGGLYNESTERIRGAISSLKVLDKALTPAQILAEARLTGFAV